MPKRWTEEAVQDVIRRYQAGDSMEQIQRDTGFSAERVKVKLVQAGVFVRGVPHKLTSAMVA